MNAVRPYKRLLAVLLFLVVLLAIFELSGLRSHFSLAFLHQKLADNPFSGLMIFILVFALGNLVQIPGWIFLAAAVLSLGRTWGGIATYVATIISCSVTYFAIRLVGGDALRSLNGKFASRLLGQLDAHPILSIVLLHRAVADAAPDCPRTQLRPHPVGRPLSRLPRHAARPTPADRGVLPVL